MTCITPLYMCPMFLVPLYFLGTPQVTPKLCHIHPRSILCYHVIPPIPCFMPQFLKIAPPLDIPYIMSHPPREKHFYAHTPNIVLIVNNDTVFTVYPCSRSHPCVFHSFTLISCTPTTMYSHLAPYQMVLYTPHSSLYLRVIPYLESHYPNLSSHHHTLSYHVP